MQRIILFISLTLLLAGCVTAPEPLTKKNSELTQGMVQMNLEVGETTKADVVENFGAPILLHVMVMEMRFGHTKDRLK